MAKINEQKVTLKLSKLLRDAENEDAILTDEQLAAILEAIQELAGKDVLIEID